MQIDIIDQLEIFHTVKNSWNSVYEADPQAQFFLSWIWQAGMLQRYDEYQVTWFILAAKSSPDASDYVAFFPLVIALEEHPREGLYSKLSMAGVDDAEHIGFICLPDYEEAVTTAFALFLIQQEAWSTFQLRNISKQDGRLNLFLRDFSKEGLEIQEIRHISDLDQINNNILPYIDLPEDWEQYLQTILSSNTRIKIRRVLRKIEDSGEFHITYATSDNFERHLEILLEFWKTNWESRKGVDQCRRILNKFSFVLRHCFEHQCLYFPVLWKGDQPLGAIANWLDFSKKTALCFVGVRDETFHDLHPGPGIILHAYGIQYAIQHGFKVYDFLMGNEAYKFSLGAKERQIKIVDIQRQNLTGQKQKLNVRTLPEAFQISAAYHRANRLVEAEQGYRKILDVQPQHPEALYGLGVVVQRRGEYQAAEDLFKGLLQVQPNNAKAWFSLGVLHQTQDQLSAAETAYRQALTLQPESSAIALAVYHNLGYTLQQQSKWEEAIACYEKARELQPDSIEADVIWANALYAQGTLSSEDQTRYAAVNHELGNTRRQAGDLKVAVEYYQHAVAMNPALADAHYHLGWTLQAQGNWEDAIASYQKAQELQPDSIEAELGLANVRHAQGNLSPEDQVRYATMNHELGNTYKQAGDLNVAVEYYRHAIALNPALADAHYHLGLVLQAQDNWEDAIASYRKVQELQPSYVEAEVSLANVFHAQKKLSPEDRVRYAAINHELGNKRRHAGDLHAAIEYYRHAIIMNPELANVRDDLRLTMEELDNNKIKVNCAKH